MQNVYLTVDEVKKHLNLELDFTEDDKYLLGLIEVAQYSVQVHLNGSPLVDDDGELLPNIRQAMLLLIGTLYNNRESVSYTHAVTIPHAYEYLLQLNKSYEF